MEQNNINPEEFYQRLKINLEEHHQFPEYYPYKFILTNQDSSEKLGELYKVFDNLDYSISTKESRNGKYLSISISCFVLDANQVIKLYKEVAKIKGIIML